MLWKNTLLKNLEQGTLLGWKGMERHRWGMLWKNTLLKNPELGVLLGWKGMERRR